MPRRKYPKEALEELIRQGYSRAQAYRILRERYGNKREIENETKDEIKGETNETRDNEENENTEEIKIGSIDVSEANQEELENPETDLEIAIDVDEEIKKEKEEDKREKVSNELELVRLFVEGIHMLLLGFLEKFFSLVLEDTAYLEDFNKRVVPLWKKVLDKYQIFLLDWTEVMLIFSYGSFMMRLKKKSETNETKETSETKGEETKETPKRENNNPKQDRFLTIEQINRMYQ